MDLDFLANTTKHCGIDMNATIDLAELFKEWENDISQKQFEPLREPEATFTDDPLALSCASHRYFLEHGAPFSELATNTVMPGDRERAQEIRKYYAEKFMWQALKGRPMTEFRSKMGQFLSGNYNLRTNELGMLYKIPYFYQEDVTIDGIISKATTVTRPEHISNRVRVKYLTTITMYRKQRNIKQFWFEDSEHHTYMLSSTMDNPLISLVEHLVDRKEVDLIANLHVRQFFNSNDDKCYFEMTRIRPL